MSKLISSDEFSNELRKMKSLTEFKQDLCDLYEIDKTNMSQQEIHQLYYEKAIILPLATGTLPKETINLFKVFRIRMNIDENVEDISLLRTFSYPDTFFCQKNGRANLKGKTVFYCSDSRQTAFAETKSKIGDLGYISIWNIKFEHDSVYYSPLFPTTMPDTNIWSKTAKRLHERKIEQAKEMGNDKSKHLEHLTNFIADSFTKETAPYNLSSWIANRMLYGNLRMDFIVYPSVANGHLTSNFAFHPNFVDQYFKLDKVFKFSITDVQNETIKYKILKVGKIERSSIEWGNPTEKDVNSVFKNKT